jgi:glycosyltransferase involved in cell wall biosynthesis
VLFLSVLELCAQLPRNRYRVEVCFLQTGPLLPLAESMGLHTAVAGWVNANDIRAAVRFAGYLRLGEFDILHAHHTWRRLRFVASRAGVPHVVHHHHNVLSPVELPKHWRNLDTWLRGAAENCDRCIADSVFVRDQLAAKNGNGAKKITVITPGLDCAAWGSHPPAEEARAEFKIPADRPVIGVVGRLGPVRRLDLLLDAAALVCAQRPQAMFVICGEGPLRAELEAKAADLGIAKSVKFLGWRRDLTEVMSAFDICPLTTVTDVFGRYVQMPMAMGKAVVGFDVGSMAEWIRNGESGWLVPTGNVKAMSEALVALIDQPKRCRALGEAAQQRCRENFQIRASACKLETLYESLMAQHTQDAVPWTE